MAVGRCGGDTRHDWLEFSLGQAWEDGRFRGGRAQLACRSSRGSRLRDRFKGSCSEAAEAAGSLGNAHLQGACHGMVGRSVVCGPYVAPCMVDDCPQPRDQPLSRVIDDKRALRCVTFMLGRPGPRLFLLQLVFELCGSLCPDAWDPRACALPGCALRRLAVAAGAARSVQRQSARSAHFPSPPPEASLSRHQQRAAAWTRIWQRLSNGCRKPW